MCVHEPPAQPPGLAAKPLPDQCQGPGWPSNSLFLMKNKPLNRHDCLQMRGKSTIPGTLHPPQRAGPKGGCKVCAGRAGVAPPEYPCTPFSPCSADVLGAGEEFAAGTTQGSPQGRNPLLLHPPVQAASMPGSLPAWQADLCCRHPTALHPRGELGAGCQVAVGAVSC